MALLIWSSNCVGQASRSTVAENSWIVVIGAIQECPQYKYQILDAQFLHDRRTSSLVGASIDRLIGLTGVEIEAELRNRADLPMDILPESLKVLVFQAALPPPVIRRLMVQASHDETGDCGDSHQPIPELSPPYRQFRPRPRVLPYRGDAPDDISIEAVETMG